MRPPPERSRAPRRLLALLRLLCLYGIGCGLLLAGGLLLRATVAAGWWDAGWWDAGAPVATGLPRVGVTVDPTWALGPARQARLGALREAGFGWVRLRLDWGELEPQRGVYAWEDADTWLADIAAAGLLPLVVLDGSPAWARAPQDRPPAANPLAPPADPAAMVPFARAFAARYGDVVRYYQVWDEPNIAPHWGNRWVEPTAYAALLKAVAPALRAADPDAIIAAAALAPTADRGHTAMDEVYFLQRMVAAGATDAFDAVAIQPFGFGYAPGSGRPAQDVLNFERAALIRRAMAAMGLGDKALWAVRFGWNRLPNALWSTVTPGDQAVYAAGALDLAAAWPWLETLGWALDSPAGQTAAEDARWGLALWSPDGAPAPVLFALRRWLLHHPSPAPLAAESAPLAAESAPLATVSAPLATVSAPLATVSAPLAALPAPLPLLWSALAGAMGLVVWRTTAAARLLPYAAYLDRWRGLSPYAQAAGWAGLLLLYYYATWPPLLGLCWLLWALLCLAQPRAGLCVALALLPFYFQHKELALVDAVLAIPPATAAVACLLPAVLLRARTRPHGAEIPGKSGLPWFAPVDAAVLALLGVSLLAAANAWHWPAYRQGLLDLVLVPLAFWFAVRVLAAPAGQPARLRVACAAAPACQEVGTSWRCLLPGGTYLLALFAGGVLVALWGLAAWLGGQGVAVDGVRRLIGPHFSPNHTALYLLRTFFLGAGLVLLARQATHAAVRANLHRPARRQRLAAAGLWAACAAVLVALVLTGSRGALLLGLPAGALVLALFAGGRDPALPRRLAAHRRARWLLPAAVLLAGIALLLLWNRLLNQQTLGLRFDLWEASLRLWRDHLLLGVGPGGFFWSYPAYLPPAGALEPNQLHPHNIWLEVATTWGLLGFGWLGILLWTTAGALPRRAAGTGAGPIVSDWLAAGLAAALIAALAHAQVDAFFLLPDLAAWNAAALALLVSRHPN